MATSHLVVLFVVTAGQNGENLGSDEEQIVLFVYLLFDVANNKVGRRLDLFIPGPHGGNSTSVSGFVKTRLAASSLPDSIRGFLVIHDARNPEVIPC